MCQQTELVLTPFYLQCVENKVARGYHQVTGAKRQETSASPISCLHAHLSLTICTRFISSAPNL